MDPNVDRLLLRADFLGAEFQRCDEAHYMQKAIAVSREVLAICTPSHPQRAHCLSQLSIHLWAWYDRFGGIENINEAIDLEHEALVLRPPGHLDRSLSLNNLAICLSTRYNCLGAVEDLNEAIYIGQEALLLHPPGHPDRATTLNNVAVYFSTRYRRLGGTEDLDKAINLNRNALELYPCGHPDRLMTLSNLAVHIGIRYKRLGRVDDLNETIDIHQETLALHPQGHPDRSKSLNNLAGYFSTRYSQIGEIQDLNEAIFLGREALALRSQDHPDRSISLNNLACNLSSRYGHLGNVEDLDNAIRFNQDALMLRPVGHPGRSKTLKTLASQLSARYVKLRDADDQEEMFILYAQLAQNGQSVSLNDLSAVKAWVVEAQSANHTTTLLAYETALRFLVQHVTALPTLPRYLPSLKEMSASLAIDAFSACLRSQFPTRAVELLEQGRGVFWNQLIRLRSPLEDVYATGPVGKTLADEFRRRISAIRDALETSEDQFDRLCRLNWELDKVVSNIRKLPGFSRFLLPMLFSDLRGAASDGPIIIVNASKYGCDAVVVSVECDPIHVTLSITKEDARKMSSRLRLLTRRAKKECVTKELRVFLREIWDLVVAPIVDILRPTYGPGSRIWWCPTAEFSLLPLHAANPYRKGRKGLSDLYISSYIPTLSALIRARQFTTSTCRPDRKRFIAIGQGNAAGTSRLYSVGTELANIGMEIRDLTMFTSIEEQDSCLSRVTEELSKNEWVHLACHGVPNRKQPFESAFALHDGYLTVDRIIQCDLQNGEFAYLSACHTTVGDEEGLDEVIHLAAAMQFAGFRSVVGTMWAVDDAHAVKIATRFYKHIKDVPGELDHTCSATALWKATRTMDVPLDQRILYVHLGA